MRGLILSVLIPYQAPPQLDDLLSTLTNGEQFNVLLLHEPTLAAKSTDFPIELQISGHCQGLTNNQRMLSI